MITEKNKSTRILKEITGYFLDQCLMQFDIHFNITKTEFELIVTAPCKEKPKSFDRFIEELNVPRELEIEEYYNALLGSHTQHEDYSFLGKNIDVANGNYENNQLSVQIIRYF